MKIRTWLVAGVALGAMGVTGAGAAAGLGTAAAAGLGTAAAAGPGTAVAQCTTTDLAASYRARGGAAGSEYGVIRLRNVSDASCSTGGYGGVSYVGGGDGTQVGAAAVRRGRASVHRVVLEPGEVATSRVREVTAGAYAGRCRERAVDGFRIYVPDETRSQFVAHPTTGCANPRVHLLSQRPYR